MCYTLRHKTESKSYRSLRMYSLDVEAADSGPELTCNWTTISAKQPQMLSFRYFKSLENRREKQV